MTAKVAQIGPVWNSAARAYGRPGPRPPAGCVSIRGLLLGARAAAAVVAELIATAITTSVPGSMSPATSSVYVPSLMPVRMSNGTSAPFAYVQTLAADAVLVSFAGAI